MVPSSPNWAIQFSGVSSIAEATLAFASIPAIKSVASCSERERPTMLLSSFGFTLLYSAKGLVLRLLD